MEGENTKPEEFEKTEHNLAKKQVRWDEDKIKILEEDKLLHPKKKIDEPKTPYLMNEGDDLYSQKLNEINKLQPTV